MPTELASPGRRATATIREVAALAGVSQMTVSRVMNSPGLVSAETTDRVRRAMAALSYRPNPQARGLAGGRTLYIGLVYDNPSPGYLAELLVGALRACDELGHTLVLQDVSADDANDPDALARRVGQKAIDAIILAPPLSEDRAVRAALAAAGLPCVLIAPAEAREGESLVAIDDEAAAAAMVAHLAGLGHERIAFVGAPEGHNTGEWRRAGYLRGLAAAGLAFRPSYVGAGAFTYRSGMEATEGFLDLPEPPTAVFAANDDMAAGAVSAAHRRGLRVPEDFSVAGFDDTGLATSVWPQLTTVRQPIADMAARAVALLGDERDRAPGSPSPQVQMDYAVVRRGSAGPVPR